MAQAATHLRPVPEQYGYLVGSLILVSLVGLVTDQRRIHAALCIVWLLIVLAYLFLSAGARIGAHFA
jgi:NADH:ubiquinone oxidoreductase subunit 6 (subunit J)